ncbi:MAG: GHKL domain-containing protein, partial [Calditrichaeota bacterium]|nr:GHKL domain-containing protein [Calditrichota bacterium]
EKRTLPPMLFINLLENAFKHGVESLTDAAWIKIDLNSNSERIRFSIENNYESKNGRKAGIGLQNLRRRLELLYPDSHRLEIIKADSTYRTELEIQLK